MNSYHFALNNVYRERLIKKNNNKNIIMVTDNLVCNLEKVKIPRIKLSMRLKWHLSKITLPKMGLIISPII